MALPWDKREFESWQNALALGKLTSKQRSLLEDMVRTGRAETVENAAALLDWQESVIDPDEHMYGL
jgi:hypothetical protein